MSVPGGEVEKLTGYIEVAKIYGIEWDQNDGIFQINGLGVDYFLGIDPEMVYVELPMRPTFSPDGMWTAYLEGDGTSFKIFDVGNSRWVEVHDADRVLHPSFSPDSSHLFYFQEGAKEGKFSLYVIDLTNLTTSLVAEDIVSEYSDPPVWLMP